MSQNNRIVTFIPPKKGYSQVIAGLAGDATFGPLTSGGWQVIDRPKQVAAVQWFDRSPFKLEFDIILSASVTDSPKVGVNTFGGVEASCQEIERWLLPVPGTYQPPILEVDGPLPTNDNVVSGYWILYSVEFREAIRNGIGQRVQQNAHITLYEYNSPLGQSVNSKNYSPAKAWAQNNLANVQNTNNPENNNPQITVYSANITNNSTTTPVQVTSYAPNVLTLPMSSYVVRQGDTPNGIASRVVSGSVAIQTYAAKLLAANNLRDPASFYNGSLVGQTIILPSA